MGFNTVAFVLNDHMHEIIKCPNAVTWGLCHPPMSDHPSEILSWKSQVLSVAREHNEQEFSPLLSSSFRVLPTYHADNLKFFVAGRNTIKELPVIRYNKTNDKRTVTLELPDWWPT